jgi:cytoskeletal protein RodZ
VEPFDFESDERAVKARQEYKSIKAAPAQSRADYPAKRSEDGQSILQTIIMIVAGLVLVILLVLFARWLYHKVHSSSSQPTVSVTSQPNDSGTASNQPGTSTQAQPSNNSNTSKSSTSATPNSGLPNSGPGNVVAIFAGSTLAAAGLHYIVSLRRFNRTGR